MKKYYLLAAGFLTLLGSCSQDDIVDVNHDGDEIRFNVVTNASTRANAIYHSNNLPNGFYVSAINDEGKSYIDKDHYTKGTDGKWTNDNNTRYWPEDKDMALSFYAHENAGETFKWDVTTAPYAKFENFTVADAEDAATAYQAAAEGGSANVSNQVDLLYAVKTNQKSSADKSPVKLNFRHALSQIVFKARNESKNIMVKIAGVKVVNVKGSGTYSFPNVDTDININDGNDGGADYPASTGGLGTWALADGLAAYGVDFATVSVPATATDNTSKTVDLTSAEGENKQNADAMMLLPQSTKALTLNGASTFPGTGSYILVNCLIYNIADGEGGEGDDDEVLIWGEGEEGAAVSTYKTKWLAIPTDFNWEQGKRYVYTLVFGHGEGGIIPGPNPEPVLVPVTFEVSVDNFVNGNNADIEFKDEDGE